MDVKMLKYTKGVLALLLGAAAPWGMLMQNEIHNWWIALLLSLTSVATTLLAWTDQALARAQQEGTQKVELADVIDAEPIRAPVPAPMPTDRPGGQQP